MQLSKRDEATQVLESDLYAFAKYINPHYMYGDIHEEIFRWISDPKARDDQLLLMPRAHLKSHCIAVWCVWQITRDPTTTIVYLSAGDDLAKIQISAIKAMITGERYRTLWPEMLDREEGKRDTWTAMGFNVEHPQRKEMGIGDLTITVKTVKANSTGLHCSHLIYDDIVVPQNAYTETGRKEVRLAVSQFASVANTGAITKAVGTRYHPRDIYYDFKEAMSPVWVKDYYGEGKGEFIGEEKVWDVKEYIAETSGGELTGVYLWPRETNPYDGKKYGFDAPELAKKRAKYHSVGEQSQFRAQYYNDPNDPASERVNRDAIQYYKREDVTNTSGVWEINGYRMNLYAAMDVAWTQNKDSDYTAIAVVGITSDWDVYILDLVRFKTDDFDIYYREVVGLHQQLGFRKLRVESNAGGHLVANEIKRLVKSNGGNLIIDAKASTTNMGKKEERHHTSLIPRVKNGNVKFYKGGLTSVAIEEIVLSKPPHDDLKDVLTQCIEIGTAPSKSNEIYNKVVPIKFNRRFGGRVR